MKIILDTVISSTVDGIFKSEKRRNSIAFPTTEVDESRFDNISAYEILVPQTESETENNTGVVVDDCVGFELGGDIGMVFDGGCVVDFINGLPVGSLDNVGT